MASGGLSSSVYYLKEPPVLIVLKEWSAFRGLYYFLGLYAKVRFELLDREVSKRAVKRSKRKRSYMGDLLLHMTDIGSFIIRVPEPCL